MAEEVKLLDDVVRDLRAIYDASHEAMRQRNCSVEDLTVHEMCELAGISEERAGEAFGTDPVQNDILWADVNADAELTSYAQPTYASLHNGLAEFADRLTSKDPSEMALVARELVRRATNTHSDVMAKRDKWALHDASVAFNEARTTENRLLLLSLRRLTASIATLEGLCMNRRGHGPNVETTRPTGPNGEPQRWTTAGIVFEALVLSSLEPDPWAETSADLSIWRLPTTVETRQAPLPTS